MEPYTATIHLRSFIAHPYWAEQNRVIDLGKLSGMNFKKTLDKRESTLRDYLKQEGMTWEDYLELVAKANRQWNRVNDDDPKSEIVISGYHLSSCLVHASALAPGGSRLTTPDNIRSSVRVDNFLTGKKKCDRIWERHVKSDQSNQRRLTKNEVIEDFEATGLVEFDPNQFKLESVCKLIDYALKNIGCGACRKMGYGRGHLISLKPLDK